MTLFSKLQIFISIFSMSFLSVQAQTDPAMIASLDSLFSGFFRKDEPGGAVLLAKDDQVVFKNGYGIADINTREPITTRTLFNTGSVSKTVVAYGILKLAEGNKLSLDDDLYKYFPDFKNTNIAKEVRLYHLLTHTSGLPDSRKVTEEHEFYLTAKDEENFAPLKQTERLGFAPGTKYEYSNPAFNGLALIIEKVTSGKWQDYIAENIFAPSGMKTSTITDGAHPASGVSHGYVGDGKNGFEELDYGEEPTFAAAGNGGLWSSVEELWLYERAIQKHLFLSAGWIEKSRTIYPFPGWKENVPSRLGLSWFLSKEDGLDLIGHTGFQGGFIADYVWLPAQKVFYVVLCNYPKPVKEIRTKLFELLQRNNFFERQ